MSSSSVGANNTLVVARQVNLPGALRGTEVVDLVEAEAAGADRFQWALGKIWIVAKGLPPDVVERTVVASGNAIRPA